MSEFGKKIKTKIRKSTGQDEPYSRDEDKSMEEDPRLARIKDAESYEDMMDRIGEESRGKIIPGDKPEEKDPEGPMRRFLKKMGMKL